MKRALDGGIDGLLARIADQTERKRIAAETEATLAQGWSGILISSVESPSNRGLIGRTIAAIAEHRGREPVETVLDLIHEENGRINMLEVNQSEPNLRQTVSHPLSCIISDGFYVTGRPHPRLYGTFPLLLGEISRKQAWLTLEEAVHKITGNPARRFRISKRGCLEKDILPMWWRSIQTRSIAPPRTRTLNSRRLAFATYFETELK